MSTCHADNLQLCDAAWRRLKDRTLPPANCVPMLNMPSRHTACNRSTCAIRVSIYVDPVVVSVYERDGSCKGTDLHAFIRHVLYEAVLQVENKANAKEENNFISIIR